LRAFACPQKPDTVLGQEWLDAGGTAASFPSERLLVNDHAPGPLPPPLPLALPDGQGREALDALYRFVAAIELTPAVAVHSQDRGGIVRFWNHACAGLFGIPAREALGQPFASLVSHLEQQDEFDRTIAAIWSSQQAPPAREWHVERRDGRRLWLHSSHFPVTGAGGAQQVFSMEMDISAHKETESALQQAALVFDNSRDAILVMDGDYHVLAVNRAYTTMTGFQAHEIIGASLPSLRLGVQDQAFYERILRHMDRHDHWEGELWSVRSDGATFPIRASLSAIRDAQGAVTSYMALLSDITDRKRMEEEARRLAHHDPLTSLPNRVLFMDRLAQALAGNRRQHAEFSLMFLDLDHFKAINDTHGHEAGDAVLQEVALRLTRCVRGVDTVSRLGGDEFVVLLTDIGGADQAAHVAATVMQSVARPVAAGGREISLSVSIGIALCPSDGQDAKTLLRHADVAMYHAKQNGRNEFCFFSPAMNAHVHERGQLENRLRRALANDEFVLDYLPEVDIASGRTVGVEALIRWRDPERGLLLPEQFIHAAEESGLIVPIGQWVLREACRQARQWRDQGYPMVVAVNLSNVQFIHNNLVHYVDEALQGSGLAPEYLDLEITEAVVMNSGSATRETIDALRERGVQLTIDDFGTGFSSLTSLRLLPLSKLKIDRSFVDEITRAPDQAVMIPAIIAVARSLRLRVVAEGVETVEQLHYLRQHGCDEFQGHYAAMASGTPPLAAPFTSPHP